MLRTVQQYRLLRADTGAPVVDVLQVALSVWSRFWGLQFRNPLPCGHGLLMVPCSSIHTMFVRFRIDVFFLSDQGIVTEIRRDVHPWRIAVPRRAAHAVLELAAGSLDITPGTPLAIDLPAEIVPDRMRFLAGKSEGTPMETSHAE